MAEKNQRKSQGISRYLPSWLAKKLGKNEQSSETEKPEVDKDKPTGTVPSDKVSSINKSLNADPSANNPSKDTVPGTEISVKNSDTTVNSTDITAKMDTIDTAAKMDTTDVKAKMDTTDTTVKMDTTDTLGKMETYSKESVTTNLKGLVKKGLCILICNGEFANEPKRPGYWWDARLGSEIFEKLGFKTVYYFDKTSKELTEALKDIASGKDALCEIDKVDCLVVVISSHGAEQQVRCADPCKDERIKRFAHTLSTKDGIVETDDILSCFDNCRALRGKPKIFFIQACRARMSDGKNVTDATDRGVEVGIGFKSKDTETETQVTERDTQNFFTSDSPMTSLDASSFIQPSFEGENRVFYEHTIPLPPVEDMIEAVMTPCYTDCLVMFASPPGKFAYSDTYEGQTRLGKQGGWLLLCLYRAILPKIQTGQTFELLELLTEVCRDMAQNYETTGKRDMRCNELVSVPCVNHMLRNDVYFSTSC